jgi:Tfp pilus assembly protein PilO
VKTKKKVKNKKRLVSANTIILAALIIIIAVNTLVWKNRFEKLAEINLLTGQIANVTQEIKKTQEPAANLQARLNEASANLTAAQTALPAQFNRNDIIDYIIGLSRECQVEVLPVSSEGWVVEKTSQSYPVLKLTATITGSFTQTNEFIYKLQHGEYKALVIPEISITRQSSSDNSTLFSGENTMVTVRLSISIYARPAAAKGN